MRCSPECVFRVHDGDVFCEIHSRKPTNHIVYEGAADAKEQWQKPHKSVAFRHIVIVACMAEDGTILLDSEM